MPNELTSPSFAIDCPTTALTLDASGRGSCILTITNTSAVAVNGRVRVAGAGTAPASVDWLSIVEPAEQGYQANESRRFTIAVAVPAKQESGSFFFRAQAYAVANPNEDFVSGPDISFTVARTAAPPAPSHHWILIAVIVLIVLVIGVVVAVEASKSKPAAETTGSTSASSSADKPGSKDGGAEKEGTAEAGKAATAATAAKGTEVAKETLASKNASDHPTAGASSDANLTLHEGGKADLALGKECTAAEQADADLELVGNSFAAALLEPVNGARIAKVSASAATLTDCEAAVLHAPLKSIKLESITSSELFTCRTHKGYVLFKLVHADNGKPYAAILHVQKL